MNEVPKESTVDFFLTALEPMPMRIALYVCAIVLPVLLLLARPMPYLIWPSCCSYFRLQAGGHSSPIRFYLFHFTLMDSKVVATGAFSSLC